MVLTFAITGCEKQETITSYKVPTHESIQTAEFRHQSDSQKPHDERMLGAIIENGPAMWFFKVQGLPETVAAHEAEFREFLKSLTFSSPEKAEWKLPDGWKEKPGGGMRFATLVIPAQPPLDLSVISFPAMGKSAEERLLDNVNRWRNQLSLAPIDANGLSKETETVEVGDVKATIVNLVGKVKPQAAMPPMAQASQTPMPKASQPAASQPTKSEAPFYPNGKPTTADGKQPGASAPADSPIDYTKPAEWSPAPLVPLSVATFEAGEGNKKVTIAVSRARGSLVDNVNRWRGQLALEPQTDAEITKSVTKLSAGSRKGDFVELKGKDPKTGRDKAILGVMIPDGDWTVFVKLSGDPDQAVKERSRLESFVESLRF
jgi:hypothetical protein